MNIIVRNFFRLLRAGIFGERESIEPMSWWKWERLYQMSLMHGVAGIISDGMEALRDDFFLSPSDSSKRKWLSALGAIESENKRITAEARDLLALLVRNRLRPILMKGPAIASFYPNAAHRTPGNIDIFFPYGSQGQKADEWAMINGEDYDDSERWLTRYTWHGVDIEHHHRLVTLTNPRLNHHLQVLINDDLSAAVSCYTDLEGLKAETLPPTLNLLFMLIRVMRYTLNEGASIKQIADMAVFIRHMEGSIDYIKLGSWLETLDMQRMAWLEGSLLINLFHLGKDEVPFMNGQEPQQAEGNISDLFNITRDHRDDWFFTQGKNIFVRSNNSSAMMWHLRHTLRYFKYHPKETTTNFFVSFSHSLSHIEE